MNTNNKEFWKPTLESLGFSENRYNEILNYIKLHTRNETNKVSFPFFLENKLPFEETTTIAMALEVLSELNLNNVHFVDAPMLQGKDGHSYRTSTWSVSCEINQEELMVVQDVETYISTKLVEETIKLLNKKLENKHLYVYKLFDQIKNINDENHIFTTHRFFIADGILEFNQAYLIYYFKVLEKPDLMNTSEVKELKLGLDCKFIPEEKKLNFLAYLEEINNKVPTEEELNEWFEREKINVL
jgi:hypothetical protein